MSIKDLLERDISLSDIKVIKNSDDTKEILSRGLSGVEYSVSKVAFRKDGNKTYLKTKTVWKWKRVPLVQFIDIMVTYTSESFTVKSCSGNIKYYEIGGTGTHTDSSPFSSGTIYAKKISYSSFPMAQAYPSSNPNHDARYYGKVGTIYNEWTAGGDITQVVIACNYAHAKLNCEPSVSFGAGVGISFAPKINLTIGNEVSCLITR